MTRSCDTRGGGLVPPWSTFPQAPRRSRTVGLPPSGAALGSPSVAFPSRAPLQRCPPDTPPRHGLLPRARPGAPAHQVRGLLEQPRAQSPLARARSALARHGVWHPGRGPSPPCSARPGSCASPAPASCLARPLPTRSGPVAGSPGGEPALPAVVSAPLALRAWPPPPAARVVPVPVAAHTTAAFPACGTGRRAAKPVQRLQSGALLAAAGMRACSGPQGCAPPRALLPLRLAP